MDSVGNQYRYKTDSLGGKTIHLPKDANISVWVSFQNVSDKSKKGTVIIIPAEGFYYTASDKEIVFNDVSIP